MSFNIDEYVDVAQRITEFYERYPDGRLTTVDWEVKHDLEGKNFVWVHAKAYRTPDDPLPGDGIAWEPVPGPTQFTRDSELMNAQTAAWGRAIVALGFGTKKIASRDEVLARNGSAGGDGARDRGKPSPPADIVIHFGKNSGTKLSELKPKQIEWYAQTWEPNPEYANDADHRLKEAAIALHLGTEGIADPVDDMDAIPF